jgi:hypothetical protein
LLRNGLLDEVTDSARERGRVRFFGVEDLLVLDSLLRVEEGLLLLGSRFRLDGEGGFCPSVKADGVVDGEGGRARLPSYGDVGEALCPGCRPEGLCKDEPRAGRKRKY